MLTLASRSPQRSAILEQLGIAFEVVVPEVEELTAGEPHELVVENALRKARAVQGEPVLGVDTTVALGSRIFGKPDDEREAQSHLQALSGRAHTVWSGMALVADGEEVTATAVTEVTFRDLSHADLQWYLGTGEWKERAGAYAIQAKGAALVESVDGDYSNVVGLPIPLLLKLLPDLLQGISRQTD